jgi:hypothetical protein
MRHRSISRALFAGVVASLAVASCGGDSGPSKEDYAQDLDKVCASVEDRFQRLQEVDPESVSELERMIDDMKSAGDAAIVKMEDLERPDGEAGEQAQQYLAAQRKEWKEQAVPALDQLVEAARKKDELALRSAVRKLDALQNPPSERIATELGADECAEG